MPNLASIDSRLPFPNAHRTQSKAILEINVCVKSKIEKDFSFQYYDVLFDETKLFDTKFTFDRNRKRKYFSLTFMMFLIKWRKNDKYFWLNIKTVCFNLLKLYSNFRQKKGKRKIRVKFRSILRIFNIFKKETPTQVFSCKICDIFKNAFFVENLQWLLFKFIKKSL